jgi:hypothetical protein
VNGVHYGGKTPKKTEGKQTSQDMVEVSLTNGDEIAIGDTRIRILINVSPKSDQPSEIPIPQKKKVISSTEQLKKSSAKTLF